MTKEQTKAAAEVMLAWVNGKTIEYRAKGATKWGEINSPSWAFTESDYRIKPREFWISVNEYGLGLVVYNQPVDLIIGDIVHVMEVQK